MTNNRSAMYLSQIIQFSKKRIFLLNENQCYMSIIFDTSSMDLLGVERKYYAVRATTL